MIHHLHTNVRSIRLHGVTTDMAFDWLGYRAPSLARELAAHDARLVAAFRRESMNNSEAWTVHIFQLANGSSACFACDMVDTSARPERCDEYGDYIG